MKVRAMVLAFAATIAAASMFPAAALPASRTTTPGKYMLVFVLITDQRVTIGKWGRRQEPQRPDPRPQHDSSRKPDEHQRAQPEQEGADLLGVREEDPAVEAWRQGSPPSGSAGPREVPLDEHDGEEGQLSRLHHHRLRP